MKATKKKDILCKKQRIFKIIEKAQKRHRHQSADDKREARNRRRKGDSNQPKW